MLLQPGQLVSSIYTIIIKVLAKLIVICCYNYHVHSDNCADELLYGIAGRLLYSVCRGWRKVVNSGGLINQQEKFSMVKNGILWRTVKMKGR